MKAKVLFLLLPFCFFWAFKGTAGKLLPAGKNNKKQVKAFTAYLKDSIPVAVHLLYDKKQLPDRYVSHINTLVCEDGLCQPLEIALYWDLLGNFSSYELPPGKPLTKWDHIEFNREDHRKMEEILSDKTSLLRDYEMKDLMDTTARKASVAVTDGVTGATDKSIQSAVVAGALYSTHVLWHIVNTHIAGQIQAHTEGLFTKELLEKMFASDNLHYQYYALNNLPAGNTAGYLPAVIRLIAAGKDYVPFFAIEKVPAEVWSAAAYQPELVSLLGKVDFNMQNELLNKLQSQLLSEAALQALATRLKPLQEKQQLKALEILARHQPALNQKSLLLMVPLLQHPNPELASQVRQLLRAGAEKYRRVQKKLQAQNNNPA